MITIMWPVIAIGVILAILILRLLRLFITIYTYRIYWQYLASRKVKPENFKFAVIGDSVSLGIGSTRVGKSLVSLILGSLKKILNQPVQVFNFGVYGSTVSETTADQLPKLNKLVPNPDLLLVEVGVNDIRNFNADKFEKDYQKLLIKLPTSAVIVEVPYFGEAREARVTEANKIINELAKSHGMSVAPLHDTVYTGRSYRNYGADFYHPNNRGHRLWFSGIWPTIAKSLKNLPV